MALTPESVHLRNLPVYTENPFVEQVSSTPRRKREMFYDGSKVLINADTGEYFGNDIALARIKTVEGNAFVKVYTAHMRTLFELGKPAQKVCEFLMHQVSRNAINKGEVKLIYAEYEQFFSGRSGASRSTFTRGMEELAVKLLVARTNIAQIWYINPSIIFNGDRARFITEIRRKKPESSESLDNNQQELFGSSD